MKIHSVIPLLLLLNAGGANAFSPSVRQLAPATKLFSQNKKQTNNASSSILGKDTNFVKSFTKAGATFFTAATIFTSSLVSDMAIAPSPAHAEPAVELSRGSFVIETTTSGDQSLLKATIDSKSLIKTLFVNRKELSSSLDRVQSVVKTELDKPVWLEVQKEILSVEGGVVPSIKITPPANWQQTVRDVRNGKLNFLVNGEIVNVAVEPSLSETEDNLIIRVKGFKGERLPSMISEQPTRPSNRKLDEFWAFWDAPYPSQYLPQRMQGTNGGILLTGTALTIWLIYVSSYMYYIAQIEADEKEAVAKREENAKKAAMKREKAAMKREKDKEQTIKELDEKKRIDLDEQNRTKVKAAAAAAAAASVQETEEDEGKGKRRRFRFWKKD